jgi:PhnB protein
MKFRTTFLNLLVLAPLACGAPKADTAQPEPAPAPAPAPVAKPAAKPIPDGFFVLTPQITVKGVDQAVEFYTKAFGAQKLFTMPGPDGKATSHAEIKIGDSIIMIDEEDPSHGTKSPLTLGGSPATLMVYSPNADQMAAAAVAAGAKITMPLEDMFWGDRYGTLVDPFGHNWAVGTHIEDLTSEQTKERAALLFAGDKKGKKAKPAKPPKPGSEPWRKVVGTPAKLTTPEGYHTVTPSIVVANAGQAIDFYKTAFGATELDRMAMPDGRVMHAELAFGDSKLMLSDAFPEHGGKSATDLGGSPVAFHFYTPDVDAVFTKATGAGAKALMPVGVMFWGDRYGAALDPSGFQWGVATHVEDVSPAEMPERMKKQFAEMEKKPTA